MPYRFFWLSYFCFPGAFSFIVSQSSRNWITAVKNQSVTRNSLAVFCHSTTFAMDRTLSIKWLTHSQDYSDRSADSRVRCKPCAGQCVRHIISQGCLLEWLDGEQMFLCLQCRRFALTRLQFARFYESAWSYSVWFLVPPLSFPRSGELRTQKLRSHLLRIQSSEGCPFKARSRSV